VSGIGAGSGAAGGFGSPSFGAPPPVTGTTTSTTMSGSSFVIGGTSFSSPSSGYPSAFVAGGGTATPSFSGTKGILRHAGGAPSGFGIGVTVGGGTVGGTTSSAADVDFESLLAHSSSQLSSLGRGFGGPKERGASSDTVPTSTSTAFPLGNKSLLELSLASRGGMGSAADNATTSTTTTYESEAKAHRFLAREGRGVSSAQLGRSARNLERLNGSAAAAASFSTPPGGISPALLRGHCTKGRKSENRMPPSEHLAPFAE